MPKDPYLTYQDMGEYFNPPLIQKTVHRWLLKGKVTVQRTPRAGYSRGNCLVRVRKSVWEKFLANNEKPLQRTRAK